jgi:UDP-N-acetylglucosamine:LPS N-acetylglucosamine transferase
MPKKEKRILAVASGGGHWTQLLRLRPAFKDHRVTYVTVNQAYREDVPSDSFYAISDATRWNKLGLARTGLQIAWILMRVRPDVVISTGAAPGYIAVRLAKLLGSKTAWLDSIANVERLSMSGDWAGKHSDLWLTQWPHLASKEGPRFEGAVV